MLKKDLAAALNLSPSMVSRLAKMGMPVDSVEAAKRWRERNLETMRRKEFRAPSIPRGPSRAQLEAEAAAALRRVAELGAIAEKLLPAGRLSAVEPELRDALAAVPEWARDYVLIVNLGDEGFTPTTDEQRAEAEARGAVSLNGAVFEALLEPVLSDVRVEQEKLGPANLTDDEAEQMGRFWYSVAAGEAALADADEAAAQP